MYKKDQAIFLAKILKKLVLQELICAETRGDLKYIKSEQFNDISEIVYQYYSEYNRPYSGGAFRSDINNVIAASLKAYNKVKSGVKEEYYFVSNERKVIIENAIENFKKNVSDINIVLDESKLENMNFNESGIVFVDNPIYMFAFLGTSGPFSVAYENEDNIPERIQYFDCDGNILSKPIVNYYIDGTWQFKKNIKKR